MFKTLVTLFLIFNSVMFASLKKDSILPEMKSKVENVLSILKNEPGTQDEKAKKIFFLMDSVFDYELMSRLSIGRQWNNLAQEKRVEFTKLFTEKLKDSYVDKLDLYTDQVVEFLGIEQPKSNRIYLNSQVVGKEEKYDIVYKFYQKGDGDTWLIYDVDLLGVSIIQTYRKQFSGFLKDKTFDELLTFLKDKNSTK